MINQILQDSLFVNQSENYRLTYVSADEVLNILVNYNKTIIGEKLLYVVHYNETIFNDTDRAFSRLATLIKENRRTTIFWQGILWRRAVHIAHWRGAAYIVRKVYPV